jgi:curli biogenesis system outer membrane secretion channel CsgG
MFQTQVAAFSLSLVVLTVGQVANALASDGSIVASSHPATVSETFIAQNAPQERRRIAVLDFDFASTGGGSYWGWWNGAGPSKGVSDMLTNKLVQGGNFIVVERDRIQQILDEQDLGQSGRVDAATAAQIGRILGVDAVVVGSITRFNLEEGSSGTSVLGVSVGGRRGSADVRLTARLISTSTAEILAAVEGSGTAQQRGNSVSVAGLFGQQSNTSGSDQILSEAAETAVNQLAEQLNDRASSLAALPQTVPNASAIIADVAGNQITLNRGTRDGFRSGMVVSVERVTREIKDPTTGEVIRTVTSPVGQIRITEVGDRSSVGTIVEGSGFRVGDQAVPMQ